MRRKASRFRKLAARWRRLLEEEGSGRRARPLRGPRANRPIGDAASLCSFCNSTRVDRHFRPALPFSTSMINHSHARTHAHTRAPSLSRDRETRIARGGSVKGAGKGGWSEMTVFFEGGGSSIVLVW